MASLVPLCRLALVLAIAMVMAAPAYAQISTPCNASAISTFFTPCVNFLTGSTANGTSPTTECCNALKSLTSGGTACFCLVVTGNVPFTLPFNRTLAISLPRACNMPGVPVQCKSSGSPLPAPGPVALGPSPSPVSTPSAPAPSGFTTSPSPGASSVLPSPITPSLAPQADTNPPLVIPPSPSVGSGSGTPSDSGTGTPSGSATPSAPTGSGRSALIPSSAKTSYSLPPLVPLIALGFAVLKYN